MIGVVPSGYDLEVLFKSAEEGTEGGNGDTPKEGFDAFQNKLAQCLVGAEGWLCFFYADAYHRISAVRFRKPYSKEFRLLKQFDSIGVFGHGMFRPGQTNRKTNLPENLIVVEGEFNQLQLQSLCVRNDEVAEIEEPEYVTACAVGGVLGADLKTVFAICDEPTICYDNDASQAGYKLVENATAIGCVSALTTPEVDSDLDDYICQFGTDHKSAWKAIVRLVAERTFIPRDVAIVRDEINEIRSNRKIPKLRAYEINQRVSDVIIDDLTQKGELYHDNVFSYYFLKSKNSLIQIHAEDRGIIELFHEYDLNPAETISQYVLERLMNEAFVTGIETQVHQHAYWDHSTFTLYISMGNNKVCRLTGKTREVLPNGTDGILFVKDARFEPFEIVDKDQSESLIDSILLSKINFAEDVLSADEQRLVVLIWVLSMFFESRMPTKPIMVMLGQRGSGKSMTARRIGRLLMGKNFNVQDLPYKQDDFDAAVTNSRYVAIDNADSPCRWLADKLAAIATGQKIFKRQLYTTNSVAEYPVRCFLAITSRTPHFGREDVVQRMLIMQVDAIKDYVLEADLLAEISENRNALMSELIGYLQDVIRAMKMYHDDPPTTRFRMADYAVFGLQIARDAGVEKEMRQILDRLSKKQSSFILEDDVTAELLYMWAQSHGDRWYSAAELCPCLSELAISRNMDFPFRGKVRSFGQYLRHKKGILKQHMEIETRDSRGRQKQYRFSVKREKE